MVEKGGSKNIMNISPGPSLTPRPLAKCNLSLKEETCMSFKWEILAHPHPLYQTMVPLGRRGGGGAKNITNISWIPLQPPHPLAKCN